MRKIARRQWWTIAVVVGAAVLVILLSLIAAGVLVLPPANPSAAVTIQEVCVTLQQGTNSSGAPWFGPSPFCLNPAGSHLPFTSPPGSVVNVPIPMLNYDTMAHTIYSAQVSPPFSVQRTSPALPYVVQPITTNPEGVDGGLMIYVQLPSTPGLASGINVTINALGAP
jgi:hypothetical protein